MICTTCGQDNSAHLVFCQMCGQRLGPRIVPPTPPVGFVPRPLSPAAGTVAQPRPVAPGAFQPASMPAVAAEPTRPNLGQTLLDPRPPVMDAPPTSSGVRICHVCAAENGPATRYCETCGSTLQAVAPQGQDLATAPAPPLAEAVAPAPIPGAPLAPGQVQPPVPPQPSPEPMVQAMPIQPARVVQLGAAGAPAGGPAAPPKPRVCGRCQGVSEPSALFCKFCGSSLGPLEAPAANGPVIRSAPVGPQVSSLDATTIPAPALAAMGAPGASLATGGAPVIAPLLVDAESVPAPSATAVPSLIVAPPASLAPVGRLVVIAKDGSEGASYPLLDQVDIGRSEGNVLFGDDRYLNPRHARIVRRAGLLYLRDLASVNGVYLRLTPPHSVAPGGVGDTEVALLDQDLFLVGQQVIRFEIVRDEEGLGPAVERGTLLFGTPSPPPYARLCQRSIEGITRDVHYLAKRETVLGRESGDIVFTDDAFLSRRHAAIRALPRPGSPEELAAGSGAAPTSFVLVDLGSSNGSYIKIRNEVPLYDGDQFRIGQQLLRVDLKRNAPVPQGAPA